MFDVSWSEMAIIGAVALIVVGPRDLPKVMRGIGRMSARARSLAAEFRRGIDDIGREAEFADLERQLEDLKARRMEEVLKGTPPVLPDETPVRAPPPGTPETRPAPDRRDEGAGI